MRVLVAMSGGVDSSVAAALLIQAGHDVVGATMKLWGGPSDSGCCSVADVEDARRVADQLGISHHVFNFTAEFDRDVVDPYVQAHAEGRTPNPCVECNRHLKFDRFTRRARQLGFDAIATGHHARVVPPAGPGEPWCLGRGADTAKDQSYVLHMLSQEDLAHLLLPVGEMTKTEVRARAEGLGLRTAAKPDSQDVCFISRSGGREAFLSDRIPLRPGTLVTSEGATVGTVDAVELVTVGQRRGLGNPAGQRIYALDVDVAAGTVIVGGVDGLMVDEVALDGLSWVDQPPADGAAVVVQASAHGQPFAATWQAADPAVDRGADSAASRTAGVLRLAEPQRRVAPGQSVVLYAADRVIGGGIVTAPR